MFQFDDLFRVAIESSPSGVLLNDAHGAIIMVNQRLEEMFLFSRGEMLGRPVEMLIPTKYREIHVALRQQYLNDPTRRPMGVGREVNGVKKSGAEFPLEIGLTPIQHESQRFILASVIDISERCHHAAEQLASQDRERDLEQQLAHMNRTFTIGEMASSLVHELTQPLSIITNNVRAAQRGLANSSLPRSEVIEAMNASAEQTLRAGKIIQRLRGFLSPIDGTHEFVDLGQLAKESLGLLRSELRKRHVTAELRIEGAPFMVDVDSVQIQQVLINLFRNALDALDARMSNGRLDVVIENKDGGVILTVKDNGCGVPAELRTKLFQPYVTSKPNGMGLGLAISRRLIVKHGGRIWFAEASAEGAAVHVWLPETGAHARQ